MWFVKLLKELEMRLTNDTTVFQKHINNDRENNSNMGQRVAGNNSFVLLGLTCFTETFVQASTFLLRMNFSANNPPQRQTRKRQTPFKTPPIHNTFQMDERTTEIITRFN